MESRGKMKRISYMAVTTVVFLFLMLLSGCMGQQQIAPSDYKGFNDTIENYFLAEVEEDLYTMKQYLSEELIKANPSLGQAKEGDVPKKSDVKKEMGDRYSIKGFDYYYDDYKEIYYSIEYFHYKRNDIESLVFGVRKEADGYKVFDVFGIGGIGGSHVKEINNGGYFTPSSIKQAMKKYPEHTFTVKEYPET
jgi:hypothetical protein